MFFAGLWQNVCKWTKIDNAMHREGMVHFFLFERMVGGGKYVLSKVNAIWFEYVRSM